MKKTIKGIFYGEPGVGKSVFAFANGVNKPFFITTDNNYAYLEDWGAKEEDHVQVESWAEAKQEFAKPFDEYDTIVVDLIEDLYMWCEDEFIKQNKITHLSDLGYGKGYQLVRKDFFLTIKALLNKDKNIILLTHGLTTKCKDKRGVEYLKFSPSDKIPEKLWIDLTGAVRYCLRCYATPEEDEDGNLSIKRYLSLSPDGTTEYGVIRGIPDTKFPAKIPLDWETFMRTVGVSTPTINKRPANSTIEVPKIDNQKVVTDKLVNAEENPIEVTTEEPAVKKAPRGRPVKKSTPELTPEEAKVVEEENKAEEAASVEPVVAVEQPVQQEQPKSKQVMTKEQKIAEIKAKLAAAKKAKENN